MRQNVNNLFLFLARSCRTQNCNTHNLNGRTTSTVFSFFIFTLFVQNPVTMSLKLNVPWSIYTFITHIKSKFSFVELQHQQIGNVKRCRSKNDIFSATWQTFDTWRNYNWWRGLYRLYAQTNSSLRFKREGGRMVLKLSYGFYSREMAWWRFSIKIIDLLLGVEASELLFLSGK